MHAVFLATVAYDWFRDAETPLLSLYKLKGGQAHLVWNGTGTLPPLPELLTGVGQVSLQLQTTQLLWDKSEGFRLLFSFHEVGEPIMSAKLCKDTHQRSAWFSFLSQ